MPLTGFDKFNNSKVASSKVISDTPQGGHSMVKWGNSSRSDVGLASKSKASINPTTDNDDGNPRASGMKDGYGTGNAGGASGDGPTPGFNGSGAGIAELNGAQGRK